MTENSRSLDELEFKADQLRHAIEEADKNHREQVRNLTKESKDLRTRLKELKDRADRGERPPLFPADDSWIRKIEWRIPDYSTKLKNMEKDTGIFSEEFSVLGTSPIQLEFFPNGRAATNLENFCSLFLWCPSGVSIRYQLRVGEFKASPDSDTFDSRMGRGHSNFCYLPAQVDTNTDTVTIGLDILSLEIREEKRHPDSGRLILKTTCPELAVAQEAAKLRNMEVDEVTWIIKRIRKRIAEVPRGMSICSPVFSAGGVNHMFMEFYPNGIKDSTNDGFCGFYLRCPCGTSLIITLYVGKFSKGPIKTDFDANVAKGLPEFCKLQEQLVDGEDHLVVGIKLRNKLQEAAEAEKEMLLPSPSKCRTSFEESLEVETR